MSRKEKWAYSAGDRGSTVTVYERTPGGVLYARVWDATDRNGEGGFIRKSLKHRDKERAKTYALQQAAKLREGATDLAQGKVTLAQVFALYQRHKTPRKKSATSRKADARRVELWTRILGGKKDPHKISLGEWDRFIDLRSSGAIDARGKPVAEAERKPVRARAVEADCDWLRWCFNWAMNWRTEQGHYLMQENPVRGFEAPKEKNPRRPVATQDRYEAIRAKADEHTFEVRWNGKREARRSYLAELLDLANGTGRRISAICALRFEDLRLNEGPYGSIRWPADTDKQGFESVVPMTPTVRSAVDRRRQERPGIGRAPLFPSPADPTKSLTRHLADKWLREAEKLAEVEPHKGSLWHAYRRKWATERKHLSDVDVAAAGGWRSLIALKDSYQHADPDTMLKVVMGGGELREAK